MYVYERKDSQGKVSFHFTYRDPTGKLVRLPADQVPTFITTLAEAKAWAKCQAAAIASKRAYIERRESWKTKYYDHDELASLYETYQKERAPNSWTASVGYLRQWIFYYYLTLKHQSNINDWHITQMDFRTWLKESAHIAVREKAEPLATSTINNIIATYNSFMDCMVAHKRMEPTYATPLKGYKPDYKAKRGAEDLIELNELQALVQALMRRAELHRKGALQTKGGRLRTMDPEVTAQFVQVLWHTGLRFNELFSLSMKALHAGKVPHEAVEREFKRHEIAAHGYIYLESQLTESKRHERQKDGSLRRKPLKSMPEIGPQYSRTIAIETPEVWNILARRYLRQKSFLEERRYGSNPDNYILFDDLNVNQARADLRAAFQELKLPDKGFHACRHSFATTLVGRTGSESLARMMTGHRTQKAFNRYQHLFEQVSREAARGSQEIELLPIPQKDKVS